MLQMIRAPTFEKAGPVSPALTEKTFSARAEVATQVLVLSSETDRKARLRPAPSRVFNISIFARIDTTPKCAGWVQLLPSSFLTRCLLSLRLWPSLLDVHLNGRLGPAANQIVAATRLHIGPRKILCSSERSPFQRVRHKTNNKVRITSM